MKNYFVMLKELITVKGKRKSISLADIAKIDEQLICDIEFWSFLERNNISVSEKLSKETEVFLLRNAKIEITSCTAEERLMKDAATAALYANYENLLKQLSNNVQKSMDHTARTVLQYEDILSEANIAFMSALKTYDESKGVKLCTYIYHCVQNALITASYSRKYDSNPNSQSVRALISSYNRYCERYIMQYGQEPADSDICEYLDISYEKLNQLRANQNISMSASLDYVRDDEKDNMLTHIEDVSDDMPMSSILFKELQQEIEDIINQGKNVQSTPIQQAKYNRNVEIFLYLLHHQDDRTAVTKCANYHQITTEGVRSIFKKMQRMVRNELQIRGYSA